MKMLFALALATGATLTAAIPVSSADAAGGCGRGAHRGPRGFCRPNVAPAPVYVRPGVRLVTGNYYRGRGYWDWRRYWRNRYRYHGGWRYR